MSVSVSVHADVHQTKELPVPKSFWIQAASSWCLVSSLPCGLLLAVV